MNEVVHCAEAAQLERLDPGGTAASFDVLVLVERPLPWAPEIDDLADVAAVVQAVRAAAPGLKTRVQTIVGVGHHAPDRRRRVLCYRKSSELFDGYSGFEVAVDEQSVVAASAALVRGDGASDPVGTTDVLVCGHGSRDRCCGSFGTKLALALKEMPAGFRLWRTSHIGGHRFAPTAVVLPIGDVWGQLDAEMLEQILRRSTHPSLLAHRYRGSAGIMTAGQQLLDRYALSIEGWPWQRVARRGWESVHTDGTVFVQLEDGSGVGLYQGIVRKKRTIRLPLCGGAPDELGTSVDEYELMAASSSRRPGELDLHANYPHH